MSYLPNKRTADRFRLLTKDFHFGFFGFMVENIKRKRWLLSAFVGHCLLVLSAAWELSLPEGQFRLNLETFEFFLKPWFGFRNSWLGFLPWGSSSCHSWSPPSPLDLSSSLCLFALLSKQTQNLLSKKPKDFEKNPKNIHKSQKLQWNKTSQVKIPAYPNHVVPTSWLNYLRTQFVFVFLFFLFILLSVLYLFFVFVCIFSLYTFVCSLFTLCFFYSLSVYVWTY